MCIESEDALNWGKSSVIFIILFIIVIMSGCIIIIIIKFICAALSWSFLYICLCCVNLV